MAVMRMIKKVQDLKNGVLESIQFSDISSIDLQGMYATSIHYAPLAKKIEDQDFESRLPKIDWLDEKLKDGLDESWVQNATKLLSIPLAKRHVVHFHKWNEPSITITGIVSPSVLREAIDGHFQIFAGVLNGLLVNAIEVICSDEGESDKKLDVAFTESNNEIAIDCRGNGKPEFNISFGTLPALLFKLPGWKMYTSSKGQPYHGRIVYTGTS